jgi:ribosomal protein S18 acetylase RimI-like enzyme
VLEIRDVDVTDEAQLHQWYDVWAASQSHRPEAMVESWENARVALPRPHPMFRFELLAAYDGETAVGAGLVNLPMADNLTVSYCDLGTAPEHRGRGVGTALLAEAERRSRAAGRERALFEVFSPDGGPTGDSRFAEARGCSVANREDTKAVDLAAAEGRWPELEAEVAEALGDYRVVTWRDRCPGELVESFGLALSRVMSLIPQGELDLEDTEWDVQKVRSLEERRLEIGLATFESAAVDAGGTVVGLTGVRVNRNDPRVAHIGITMVLPEHRGHRLGLATKLASHRALRAAVPECRLVATSNSELNTHMSAINEALGYHRLETLIEYHKRV